MLHYLENNHDISGYKFIIHYTGTDFIDDSLMISL